MSLVKEIKNDVINKDCSLPDILRKCLTISYSIDFEPFRKWSNNELNGYSGEDSLPSYRKYHLSAYGNFSGFLGSGLKNVALSPISVAEKHRDYFYKFDVYSSIADCYYKSVSSVEEYTINIDPYFLGIYGDKFYKDMNCYAAWMVAPKSIFVGIVDIVKTKILNFMLEIEKKYPDIEIDSSLEPSVKKDIGQIFNHCVISQSPIVCGDQTKIEQHNTINKGDLDQLISELKKHNVENEDINNIKEIVNKTPVLNKKENILQKFSKVLVKIGPNLLPVIIQLIAQYYGLIS